MTTAYRQTCVQVNNEFPVFRYYGFDSYNHTEEQCTQHNNNNLIPMFLQHATVASEVNIANELLENIVLRIEAPSKILSDQSVGVNRCPRFAIPTHRDIANHTSTLRHLRVYLMFVCVCE